MSAEEKQQIISHIDLRVSTHEKEEMARYQELKEDINKLREDLSAFVEAWQQAKGVIHFVKWLSGISGALAAIVLFLKDHIK